MGTYDTREAVQLLAKARLSRSRSPYREQMRKAAEELIADTLEAARAAGFDTRKEEQGSSLVGEGSVFVRLTPGVDGVLISFENGSGRPTPVVEPEIEFDAASGQWVSKKSDAFLVPVPGEPHRRRSAVAAVAERIAEVLGKSS